jgi:hypothetical protein
MKSATLMVSLLAAVEVFLSGIAFGGCTTADRTTVPQSAIVVASNSAGVD